MMSRYLGRRWFDVHVTIPAEQVFSAKYLQQISLINRNAGIFDIWVMSPHLFNSLYKLWSKNDFSSPIGNHVQAKSESEEVLKNCRQ